MQLLLFKHEPSIDEISNRVDEMQKSSEKVRRGIYAKHSQLNKMYIELKNEFEQLKSAITKGHQ
jgi:hypothetical protein